MKLFGFILILLSSWSATSQTRIEVHLDSNKILIGDQLRLYFKVTNPTGNIDFPDLSNLDFLEVIDMQTTDSSANLINRNYLITSFDSGYHIIPPLPIGQGIDTIYSNSLALEVFTVPTDSLKVMPIYDIIREPFNLKRALRPILLTLLGILIFGLILYLVRKKKKMESVQIFAPPTPYEHALAELKLLREEKLWQAGDVKGFQSKLTYIMREYIQGRFEVPALKSTSSEIRKNLKDLGITTVLTEKVDQVLQIADLVKFAKATPPASIHESFMDVAEEFVRETKPKEPEIPEA